MYLSIKSAKSDIRPSKIYLDIYFLWGLIHFAFSNNNMFDNMNLFGPMHDPTVVLPVWYIYKLITLRINDKKNT